MCIRDRSYTTSYIGEHPGADDVALNGITTDAAFVTEVNEELGLKAGADGAMKTISCEVSSKKIDSCTITVVGSDTEYTATQTKIEKKATE